MDTLRIQVFKDSFGPVIELLNQYEVPYQMRMVRSGVPMASAETIEVVRLLSNAALWGALASVIVAFIKARTGRKVIITTQDKTIIHAEGYSLQELTEILKTAASVTAIDTQKDLNSATTTAPPSQAQ